MTAPMPWFRMYVDFLNDPKMIALAFEDQRHFIGVLALKSDGVIDSGCDAELLDRIVAQRLWIDPAAIVEVKKRLVSGGLIGVDWQPIAWEKRQYNSDRSAERTRKYRQRQRESEQENTCDVAVTSQQRFCDALDTDTETETENTRRTRSRAAVRPDSVPERVWQDFQAIRRAKRTPLTDTALNGIAREASKAGMSLSDALAMCCERGWQGFNASWVDKPKDRTAGGKLKVAI